MYDQKIQERVIALFAALTEADEVSMDSDLTEDLEISSMDILFVISSLEDEFQVKIPEKAIRKMYTVGDVVSLVSELRK